MMVWEYFTHFHKSALCYTDVHVYRATSQNWIKMLVTCQFHWLGKLSLIFWHDPVLFLDYSTLKMHMWQFDSRFSKAFNIVLKESSRGANAKYDVLVIMALKI